MIHPSDLFSQLTKKIYLVTLSAGCILSMILCTMSHLLKQLNLVVQNQIKVCFPTNLLRDFRKHHNVLDRNDNKVDI